MVWPIIGGVCRNLMVRTEASEREGAEPRPGGGELKNSVLPVSHSPYVVLRISNRSNPRYHCPFLYDDAHNTIGGLSAVAGHSRAAGGGFSGPVVEPRPARRGVLL